MGSCIEVAVEAPIGTTLSYSAVGFDDLKVGQSVKVPLGKRVVHGVITDVSKPTQAALKIKNVLELEQDRPNLSKTHLEWFEWIARYYHYPIGEVVKLAFPPGKKKTKEKTAEKNKEIGDQTENATLQTLNPHLDRKLTEEQLC
jgi:primosomal protein N' (replication factor Y)